MSWRNFFTKSSRRRTTSASTSSSSPSSSLTSSCSHSSCSLHGSRSSEAPPLGSSQPDPARPLVHRSVLIRFAFVADENNTTPVRLIEHDGAPTTVYNFLHLLSEAAVGLLYNRSLHDYRGGADPDARFLGRLRATQAMIRACCDVRVRWRLGDGLLGHSEVPLLDAANWDEIVGLLAGIGGSRHCVVVDLPDEKVDWLRNIVPGSEHPEDGSVPEPEECGPARGSSDVEWVPVRC